MNKEYYEELKKEIEKFNEKNISKNLIERRNNLQKFINSRFSAYPDKNVSAVIAFYEYTHDKKEYDWLNEHYTKILSRYFPEEEIEKQFDVIVNENDGLLLNSLIKIGNNQVVNNLINTSYEKSKQDEKYLSVYESIKNKCINSEKKKEEYFSRFELDEELSKDLKENKKVSDLGEKILDSYVIDMPKANTIEAPKTDDSLLKNHEERVAKANEKIGLDPSVKPLDKSINLDNFSSSNVNETEREKRYQEIAAQRKLAEQKADEIVGQAANDLNVDKKDIYKALDEKGVNPLNLKPGDIVISSDMLKQVSNNNSVDQMNQSSYQKFINSFFSKVSFKDSDIKLEVSEIDKSKKIVIAPGSKAQKIAKAENSLIKVQRLSQNVKKYFVDTKNKAKEAIKTTILNLNNKRQALTDSIKENVSNKLYDIADKISGAQENIYEDNDNIQIQDSLNNLKNNKVIALSGSLMDEIPHPLLAAASNKKM